ncbi:MAG: tandem-95 repeat protein [Flavobacteriales bacterium]
MKLSVEKQNTIDQMMDYSFLSILKKPTGILCWLLSFHTYLLSGQVIAVDDENITAHDYVALVGDVSTNDILPPGSRTFRFLNESIYGSIQWLNQQQGTYTYLVEPINIALYENQDDTIIYEVCAASSCDTALLIINLRHLNNYPVTQDDTLYLEQGSSRMGNVSVNDFDPDSISDPDGPYLFFYPLIAPQQGTLNFLNINGVFSYTANTTFQGMTSFVYKVFDMCGWEDIGTVRIFVTGPNEHPIASNLVITNVPEDIILQSVIENAVTDAENDPLTYSLAVQPQNGTATVSSNGSFTYTPSPNFTGVDTLRYAVMDLVGQTDTALIFVSVFNDNNDSPVAIDQAFTILEDTPLNESIAFVDVVDGDALSFSLEDGPLHGAATINSAGQLIYTPEANYVGTDIISYRSCDEFGLCDVGNLTIQINGVNDAPITNNDWNEVLMNGILLGELAPNVQDIDSPVNETQFTLSTAPTHGTIQLNEEGAYSYEPFEYFYGNDSISYTVCDNQGTCSTGELFITVTLVNVAPEAQNAEVIIYEDAPSIIHLEEFTFDFGNGDLTYDVFESSAVGVFENITNTGLSLNPSPNLVGSFVINYEVCDTGNLCDTAQITLTIEPINDYPATGNTQFIGAEDQPLEWFAEYSDIDSEELVFSITSQPQFGSIADNTYLPNQDFVGTDSFVFVACDNQGACTNGLIQFEITAVNDSPVGMADVINGQEDSLIEATVAGNDNDIDSSELIFEAISESNPYNISIDSFGNLSWLPPSNFTGLATLQYRVCDNSDACDTALVSLNIEGINDTPIVNFPSTELSEDSEIVFDALSFAFDIEGHTLFQSLVTTSGVEALLNPQAGSITLTATSNFFGNAWVVLNTCDVLGACSVDTLQVEVSPINDSPYGIESSFATFENVSINDTWYNYFFDIDDNDLTFNTTASFGSISPSSQGSFVYTPLENFLGQDTLWVVACDSSGICITGQFLVEIFPPNHPPVTENVVRTICQSSFTEIDLSEIVYDEIDSAGNLQYTFNSAIPSTFAIDPTSQLLTITPSSFYSGIMTVDLVVCDNASPSLCSSAVIELSIIATNSPQLNDVAINHVSCHGMANGSIVIEEVLEATGVNFLWENGGTDSSLINLEPGLYTVQLIGLSQCSTPTIAQFSIVEPEPLQVELIPFNETGQATSGIESAVIGGTQPYSYLWMGPDGYSSNEAFANSVNEEGDYVLEITDANGCTTAGSVTITSVHETAGMTLQLYPNPTAMGFVVITHPEGSISGSVIRVLDSAGRLVHEETMNQRSQRVMLDTIVPGYYRVQLVGTGIIAQSGLIITK